MNTNDAVDLIIRQCTRWAEIYPETSAKARLYGKYYCLKIAIGLFLGVRILECVDAENEDIQVDADCVAKLRETSEWFADNMRPAQ